MIGYPIPQLRAAGGVVIDIVGGLDLIVVAGSELGTHAFENLGHKFELHGRTLYGDGVAWDLPSGRSSDGRQLTRGRSRDCTLSPDRTTTAERGPMGSTESVFTLSGKRAVLSDLWSRPARRS